MKKNYRPFSSNEYITVNIPVGLTYHGWCSNVYRGDALTGYAMLPPV
jgi:hypothetical protein